MKNIESQEEIFFTMKVYATTSKGKLKTLKYSIDFHPPFEADTTSIKPYASPIVDENMGVFNRIFDNVKELIRYISNPVEYNPKSPQSKGWRLEQQKKFDGGDQALEGSNQSHYLRAEQSTGCDGWCCISYYR